MGVNVYILHKIYFRNMLLLAKKTIKLKFFCWPPENNRKLALYFFKILIYNLPIYNY